MKNDSDEEWVKYPKKKIIVEGYELEVCLENCQCEICQEAKEICGIVNKQFAKYVRKLKRIEKR